MESSMKMMNNMMPLVSVFFCLSLPIGLGIYWIAGAVFRGIQQVVVNKHMEKMDMDALIRKNVEKMNAKRKKQGLPPKKISEHAKVNFKDLEDAQKVDEKKQAERQKKIQDSTEYYKHADAKPGSIAAKARMVQQFDEQVADNRNLAGNLSSAKDSYEWSLRIVYSVSEEIDLFLHQVTNNCGVNILCHTNI